MDNNGLVIVLACSGAGLSSLMVAILPGATPEWVVFAAAAGGAVGIVIAWIDAGIGKLLHIRSRTIEHRDGRSWEPRNQPSRTVIALDAAKPKPQPVPLKPFRERLAHFTHQDESVAMTDDREFESKMPFRSAIHLLHRVPPKSADFIREVLVSIRRAVRAP